MVGPWVILGRRSGIDHGFTMEMHHQNFQRFSPPQGKLKKHWHLRLEVSPRKDIERWTNPKGETVHKYRVPRPRVMPRQRSVALQPAKRHDDITHEVRTWITAQWTGGFVSNGTYGAVSIQDICINMTWATAFDTNWISKFPCSPQAMKQLDPRETPQWGEKQIRQKPSTSGFTERLPDSSRSSRPSLLKIYGNVSFIWIDSVETSFRKWCRFHISHLKTTSVSDRDGCGCIWPGQSHKPVVKKSWCVVSAGDPRVWLELFFQLLTCCNAQGFCPFPENSPLISLVFFEHSKTAKPKTLHPTAQKPKTLSIWKPKIPAYSQCFH